MPINYVTTVRSARMQVVADAIDAGSGPGYVELCSEDYAEVLSVVPLAKPSFTELNGVLTMANVPRTDASADHSGDAAIARVYDSNGDLVADGLTVGTSNADILLNSVEIGEGQQVTIASGRIRHV